MDDTRKSAFINRRHALSAAAALPLTLAVGRPTAALASSVLQHCVLTPQSVEGPFYFDPQLERSDVTEGRPGVPLVIRITVLEAGPCTPLIGARVDIWNAGADGEYSGYTGGPGGSRVAGTSLRGTQMTDQAGLVVFKTIYPAWYPGRTPHIHFKVFLDDRNVLMGQTYFPDALSEYLFANVSSYRGRSSVRDTFNSTDALARMDPGHVAFCDIKEAADHYTATLVVGVDRQGKVISGGPLGGRPRPPDVFSRGRLPGAPPELHRTKKSTIIVPGVPLAEQHPT